MDQNSMDEFFRMVGFDPTNQNQDSSSSGQKADSDSIEAEATVEGFAEEEKGARSSKKSRTHRKGKKHQASWQDLLSALFQAGGKKAKESFDGGDSSKPRFVWDVELKKWGVRSLIALVIALVIALAFCYWWFHPSVNIHNSDFWFLLFIIVLIPLLVLFRTLSWRASRRTDKHTSQPGKAKLFKILSFIPLAVMVFFVLGTFAMWSFWPGNAHRYASVLEVEDGDFASEIEEVNYDSIPVIDRASAVILGNRTLGEIPDFVSQFEISNVYSQINYQGRPVRVSPLNYADIFKWFNNKSNGVPAYVLVDMASQDTKIVRLEEPMHYVESDPFFNNIDRYVQLKYPTYLFEEKAFEIDEEGIPWWVCPVQTRTIGLFGGETIKRVVLVNACTGECQDYAIEECPQWVDRAYPSDLLIQQYNWRGAFQNGWLNSWIGQSGVVQTTPGSNGQLGYNYIAKDDDVWVYTGVTSATADNAIVGFVLANQRTGDARYYSVAGATEESAMASAEGQVQNLKYEATFPLLLNINGQPTYFMALKDSAGLAKKFAMLDIQRYQNVAVGDTVSECQKSYKALLATNGALASTVQDGSFASATGTIEVMTEAVIDGNSHFYLKISGSDQLFDCALPGLIEVVGFKQGDEVTLAYIQGTPTSSVQSISAASSSEESNAKNKSTDESSGKDESVESA